MTRRRHTASPPVRRVTLSAGSGMTSPLVDSLVAYWDFGPQSLTADSAGSLDLSDSGSPSFGVGVGTGQTAAVLDGGAQFTAPADDAFAVNDTSGWSIFGWFRLDSGALSNTQGLATKARTQFGGLADVDYYLQVTTAGALQWVVALDGGGTTAVAAPVIISEQSWYFVQAGVSAGSTLISVNGAAPTSSSLATPANSTQTLKLGTRLTGSTGLVGRMQAWGVASRAITQKERARLFNSGKSALLYGDV